jgi:hypothetical protein
MKKEINYHRSRIKMEISRSVDIKITPTAKEMGRIFANSHSDFQADFLNEVAIAVEEWKTPFGKIPFAMQAQSITDEEHLTKGARKIMETLGEALGEYK